MHSRSSAGHWLNGGRFARISSTVTSWLASPASRSATVVQLPLPGCWPWPAARHPSASRLSVSASHCHAALTIICLSARENSSISWYVPQPTPTSPLSSRSSEPATGRC